jgi:hypothetical protein
MTAVTAVLQQKQQQQGGWASHDREPLSVLKHMHSSVLARTPWRHTHTQSLPVYYVWIHLLQHTHMIRGNNTTLSPQSQQGSPAVIRAALLATSSIV